MSKVLQHLVSKQKKRIQISGFDLDLTYITDQIIAMGLSASGVTGIKLQRNYEDPSEL